MILGIFIFPTLAIAVAVPPDKLGMENGIMVAFQTFFDAWHVGFLSNVLAAAMVFGALASVVTWVAGPSRGIFNAAKTGLLPPVLQKQNKQGVQIGVLIPQGIIVTALALIYVLAPNVSDVFLALIGMAAALYVIMYLMMFAAAVVLRKKRPDIPRGYKVPALNLVSAIGFISCALALIMSFIPPEGESAIPPAIYPFVVALVVVLLGVPPLIFYALKKQSWDLRKEVDKNETE
jgi:amino acid transporter